MPVNSQGGGLLGHGLGYGLAGLAAAFLFAWLLEPAFIGIALRFGILDRPVGNKIHRRATPMLGGVAMAIAFLVTSSAFPTLQRPWQDQALAGLLTGCALATLLGVIDEVWCLPARWHLVGQIVVVLAAIGVGFPLIREVSNPLLPVNGTRSASISLVGAIGPVAATVVGIAFTVFWIVGMMNTINFLDGLDGLAGGVSAFAALFLGLWAVIVVRNGYPPTHDNQNVILPLLLCGAVAGFLPFNWAPARVFMGDSGAMFIGFALGGLSIFGPVKLGTALLVLLVPILDVAWAIVRRVLSGRSLMVGDKHHVYHRMIELGFSRRTTVLAFYALTLALGVVDLSLVKLAKLIAFILLALAAGAGLVLLEIRGRQAAAGVQAPAGEAT